MTRRGVKHPPAIDLRNERRDAGARAYYGRGRLDVYMNAGSSQKLTLHVTQGEDPHEGYHPAVAGSASPDRNPVPDALGLPDAPRLLASTPGGAGMSFFELDCFRRNVGVTKPIRENAFLIALQLKTCPDFDLYSDGRLIRPRPPGVRGWRGLDLRPPHDPLHRSPRPVSRN